MKFFHPGPQASSIRPQPDGTCHNCHATVSASYCGACGQSAQLHVASAHEFIHHFIGHYVAAEGKLWSTLGLLLLRPGQLTLEFIRGRRSRYIDPLRLLLTVSLACFLLMKGWGLTHQASPQPTPPAAASTQTAAAPEPMPLLQRLVVSAFRLGSANFAANFEHERQLPAHEKGQRFYAFWLATGPTLALLLIPLVAAWLKLVQLGAGWRYGEHLVFSFHLLALSLPVLTLGILLGGWFDLSLLPFLAAIPLYVVLAMRRVYGGHWALVLLRAGLLMWLSVQSLKFCVWIAWYAGMALTHT